jgi:two-component system chemotaxis sensor kinase CheA
MTALGNELLEQFLIEGRELIQEATEDLLALERQPEADRIDRLFRAFHTLKGSVGIFDFAPMSQVLHAAEDLLAALRNGSIGVTAGLIDRALETLDQIGGWLEAIEAAGTLPESAAPAAVALTQALRAEMVGDAAPGPRSDAPALDWTADLFEGLPGGGLWAGPVLAIRYEPLEGCYFSGDDPLNLIRQVPGLLALRIDPREPWAEPAEMDPFSCNIVIRALASTSRDQAASVFRFLPDQVQFGEIEPSQAVPGEGEGPPALAGGLDPLVRDLIEAQRRLLLEPCEGAAFAGRFGAAARVAVNALRFARQSEPAIARVEAAHAEAAGANNASALVAALDHVLAPASSSLEASDARNSAAEAGPPGRSSETASRILRVDAGRIDALVALSGELAIAKNALGVLCRDIERGEDPRAAAGMLRAQHESFERLVAELHRGLMRVRLLPVGQLFRRFARPVRDIAAGLGKDIAFRTEGDDTEADRTIVENLFEPLLHILRNALDHGVELSEARLAAGKPARAQVVLRAFPEGERVTIEVEDNGRGVDPALIRRIAHERGVVSEADAAALSDEEAVELIFAPGFSTAAAVSDISGRGVGMDAVRSAIDRLGGRVGVSSRPGAGTVIRLSLPATMLMSRVMTVQVGRELFGVALDAMVETARIPRDRILPVRDGHAVVIRDRTLPVLDLAALLDVQTERPAADEACLFVTEHEGDLVAIEVDGFGERLEVLLKPADGLLAGLPWIAGTTLLGSGRVLLVVDLVQVLG